MWTPAHFWALALFYKDDYARAGIPMMPVVRGDAFTRGQILLYALSLVIITGLLALWGRFSAFSDSLGILLTLIFAWESARLYWDRSNKRCLRVFYFSCFYLLILFSVLALDAALSLT